MYLRRSDSTPCTELHPFAADYMQLHADIMGVVTDVSQLNPEKFRVLNTSYYMFRNRIYESAIYCANKLRWGSCPKGVA